MEAATKQAQHRLWALEPPLVSAGMADLRRRCVGHSWGARWRVAISGGD